MKRPLLPALTFAPGASTLNLSGIANFDVRNLFAVINLKTGALVYGPLAGFTASAISGTTLTLTAPLAGMLATDQLMVIYDDGGKPAEDGTLQQIYAALSTLATDQHVLDNTAKAEAIRAAVVDMDGKIATDASLQTLIGKLPGLGIKPQAGSLSIVVAADHGPLPAVTGQATGTKQDAGNASLATIAGNTAGLMTDTTGQAIKALLAAQASISESIWYDPTTNPFVFYFRRVTNTDGVITEIWTDPAGNQVTFSAAWKPLNSNTALQAMPAVAYDCTAADTGMSAGDVLIRIIVINYGVSPPTLAVAMWVNSTTGAVVTSPNQAKLKEATRNVSIPDGYDLTFGAQADAPVALPTTAGSFMATLRGYWTDFRARIPVLGVALANASMPIALATDQLATLAKDGTDATAATMPAGGAGLRGWLSGIYIQAYAMAASLVTLVTNSGTSLTNDTTALAAITAATTARGAVQTTPPESFDAGASGDAGVRGMIWKAVVAIRTSVINAAASLVSLVNALGPRSATGALGAANAAVAVSGGPYGAVGFKLVGTSTQTISALGTRDGTVYDVPLGIITEVPGGGSTSGQTLSLTGAGPFFGYVEAAGCLGVQLLTSAYTSGSLAATLSATPTSRSVRARAPVTDPIYTTWSLNGQPVTDSNAPSVRTAPVGLGALLQAPAGSTNGTPLTNAGAMPVGAKAALLVIPPGGEIDLTIAAAQPSSAPFSVPYPNQTPVTLEVLIELNGMLGFVTKNQAGTVNSASAPCGMRWL